jgi:phosphate uptake regulator
MARAMRQLAVEVIRRDDKVDNFYDSDLPQPRQRT